MGPNWGVKGFFTCWGGFYYHGQVFKEAPSSTPCRELCPYRAEFNEAGLQAERRVLGSRGGYVHSVREDDRQAGGELGEPGPTLNSPEGRQQEPFDP